MLNILNINNSNCKKKIVIPDGFRELLQDLAVEVLRNQPDDIIGFCIDFLTERRNLTNPAAPAEGEKKKFGINMAGKVTAVSPQPGNAKAASTGDPIETVKNSYLFKNSDKDAVSKFSSKFVIKEVPIGEELTFSAETESPVIYFILSGKFELLNDPGKNKVAELLNEGYFGDFAEALTAVAKTPSKLIVIKKQDIDSTVLDEIAKRRNEFSEFINDYDVFSELSNYGKRVVIDSMVEKTFEADQTIIKEGDAGTEMFLIYEGFVSVKLDGKEINSIGEGGFFGELAIIDDEPRAASVITIGDTKVMAIPFSVVKTLIGPMCKAELDSHIKTYFHEEGDDDDDESELLTPKLVNLPRTSVSAGKFNPEMDDDDDDEDMFEGIDPADLIKSEEQKVRLRACCKNILLFRCLDDEELEVVIEAMFRKVAKPGDIIIKRGDDGDNFYVVDNGIYDILVPINDVDTVVAQFTNEGSFGELALMYNTPRNATVRATTDGLLWAMNREMFRKIVLKKAFQKRQMYENLLGQVSLFKNISVYERTNVADALRSKVFEEGEKIIVQGEEGLEMFFIEEGIVQIYMDYEDGTAPEMLGELERGKYFGEMALINQKPRAATISAKTRCKIAVLDRESFERLLGPCIDVMKRDMEGYKVTTQRKSFIAINQ